MNINGEDNRSDNGTTDDDTDWDSTSSDINNVTERLEDIIDLELEYIEPQDKKYYIGCYTNYFNILLLVNKIRLSTFYESDPADILDYFYYCSGMYIKKSNIEIVQLHILEDGTYSCVLKTHWIRIIQRAWRKTLVKRQHIQTRMMQLSWLRQRELGNIRAEYYPGLNGLLSNI